jgi:hypothetical protein
LTGQLLELVLSHPVLRPLAYESDLPANQLAARWPRWAGAAGSVTTLLNAAWLVRRAGGGDAELLGQIEAELAPLLRTAVGLG